MAAAAAKGRWILVLKHSPTGSIYLHTRTANKADGRSALTHRERLSSTQTGMDWFGGTASKQASQRVLYLEHKYPRLFCFFAIQSWPENIQRYSPLLKITAGAAVRAASPRRIMYTGNIMMKTTTVCYRAIWHQLLHMCCRPPFVC